MKKRAAKFACLLLLPLPMIFAGISWDIKTIVAPIDDILNNIMFVDDMTGWVCGFFPGILRTDDGGETWIRLRSNLLTVPISAAYFIARDVGWAAGVSKAGIDPVAVILISNDGGRSWNIQKRFEEGFSILGFYFIDAKSGFAIGSDDNGSGLILHTSDGGLNWEAQFNNADCRTIRRIRFIDRLNGWALSDHGVLHTKNGGLTWIFKEFKDTATLDGLSIIDRNTIWVSGGWGKIMVTTDGGTSWSNAALPQEASNVFLTDIAFKDKLRGWACGAKGEILSTKDGGNTWELEKLPITNVLFNIAYTKNRIFITAGEGQIVVKSTSN